MDIWSAISAIATCIQTVILIAASYYALNQFREARRARVLAILMPLRYEIDGPESRENRFKLFNELPEDLTSLTREQDLVVDQVVVEYDNLGKLIRVGLVDFEVLASMYSLSTERCWRRVAPWVAKERERRGGGLYAEPFQMFAERCIEYNAQTHTEELQPFKRVVKRSKGSQ